MGGFFSLTPTLALALVLRSQTATVGRVKVNIRVRVRDRVGLRVRVIWSSRRKSSASLGDAWSMYLQLRLGLGRRLGFARHLLEMQGTCTSRVFGLGKRGSRGRMRGGLGLGLGLEVGLGLGLEVGVE